jgi:hypothetical protein
VVDIEGTSLSDNRQRPANRPWYLVDRPGAVDKTDGDVEHGGTGLALGHLCSVCPFSHAAQLPVACNMAVVPLYALHVLPLQGTPAPPFPKANAPARAADVLPGGKAREGHLWHRQGCVG